MANREYTKLPGAWIQLSHMTRLYASADHLLKLTVLGNREEYKRFYYQDIQALQLRRTSAYLMWNLLWGSITAVCLVATIAQWISSNDWAQTIGPMIFTGIFGLTLTLNLVRGPSCNVVLRTAVHEEPLTSLCQVRLARKAFAVLVPRIQIAQAEKVSPAASDDRAEATELFPSEAPHEPLNASLENPEAEGTRTP